MFDGWLFGVYNSSFKIADRNTTNADLLQADVCIGIVTAAGYASAQGYYNRLHGLLDIVATSPLLTDAQRANVVVMGGEANYLFAYDAAALPCRLRPVPRHEWMTPEMAAWSEPAILALLDAAEAVLRERVDALAMPAKIIRKERAVGIVASDPAVRLLPESLEDTVLAVDRALARVLARNAQSEHTAAHNGNVVNIKDRRVEGGAETDSTTTTGGGINHGSPIGDNTTIADAPLTIDLTTTSVSFCAFNGGRDVFVDIGDKSWGVRACQDWFSRLAGHMIGGQNTVHVGDQFLSAGANDYKARTVSTTAWIASPEETVELLDEMVAILKHRV